MTAPKTKMSENDSENRGIQLIVFAPINADPKDEENRIYMVCPSSLKVVEVVEKFDEEAEEFLQLLGKHKKKTKQSSKDFVEDLDALEEITDDMIEDNSGSLSSIEESVEIKKLESELDEDIVTFASEALGDIFPQTEGEETNKYSDVDLADALALLDEEDDESDLKGLEDFKDDDDALPSL